MIVKPRIRGFICTTAHPSGCAAHVNQQIDYVIGPGRAAAGAFGNVLVLGCSGGYGLASRIVAGFGCGAKTLGVSFEKAPTESKTASAGWYNNKAFEARAAEQGLYAKTLDGDAFSDAMRDRVLETIKADLGQIDLVVYSLASPVRQHPKTEVLHRSLQHQAAGQRTGHQNRSRGKGRSVQCGIGTGLGRRDCRYGHGDGR
jgi:enoyl-[acyl-carrier protein] reductase/trans-2-enoyl-CoA reductase (NAD+)